MNNSLINKFGYKNNDFTYSLFMLSLILVIGLVLFNLVKNDTLVVGLLIRHYVDKVSSVRSL